jgi:hypothetical protein
MIAPVFIIGGSRTGSEMLKTMLSVSPELDFVDELFLRCPRWLHPDLESLLRTSLGRDPVAGDTDRVLEVLYSGEPYGWVWGRAEEKFDRDVLRGSLEGSPMTMKRIFDGLMAAHAAKTGKQGRGAKFPMHYSHSRQLVQWYPDCKLLHTTRDPRAVYASQANKYVKPEDPFSTRAWMKARQFVHINLQVAWTARLHRHLRGLKNYRLVRYEDVVRKPEHEIMGICDFLEVEFQSDMLSPHQYGSSYGEIRGKEGVDASSLEAWRKRISPLSAALLRFLHPVAWRRFGYGR